MCIGLCDKCGGPVLQGNDARKVDRALHEGALFVAMAQPRHLFPVIVDGSVICEGSPSRMESLKGLMAPGRLEDFWIARFAQPV